MRAVGGLVFLLGASMVPAAEPMKNATLSSDPGAGGAKAFAVAPVGYVDKTGDRTRIRLDPRYRAALLGLKEWSHVWVIYWFDRNDTPEKRAVLQVHPRGRPENPLTGVFATRSPLRPNPVALSLCRLISVKDEVIEIEGIDAFDRTPILDLKPFVPSIDRPSVAPAVPGWAGD